MAEKTLGKVARDAWYQHRPCAADDWQAVADAVIAANEARRWKAIESAPKDGWFWINRVGYGPRLGRQSEDPEYDFEFFEQNNAGHGRLQWNAVRASQVTHWTPIPAPPKEAE